jgi:hypothetical protein
MTDNDWPDVRQDIAAARRQGYRAGVARGLHAGLMAARRAVEDYAAAQAAVEDLLADPLPVDGLVEQYYNLDLEGEDMVAVNDALSRGIAHIQQAIFDQAETKGHLTRQEKLVRRYTRADDATMIRLMITCDRIDNHALSTTRRRGEAMGTAMGAALELVKAGVPIDDIIDTHLDAAEDVAEAARCTLVDAARLVAQASAVFNLGAGWIQHLAAFVKQAKAT